MKLYPNLIPRARKKTKNWTKWDCTIQGVEENSIYGNGRRSALIPSTTNWYTIYTSIMGNYLIEKINNEIIIYNNENLKKTLIQKHKICA